MLPFGLLPTRTYSKRSPRSPGPHRSKEFKVAEAVWILALFVLGVYELWALTTHHMTLSRAIWVAQRSEYGPLLPFMAGLLCGHFFWSGYHDPH